MGIVCGVRAGLQGVGTIMRAAAFTVGSGGAGRPAARTVCMSATRNTIAHADTPHLQQRRRLAPLLPWTRPPRVGSHHCKVPSARCAVWPHVRHLHVHNLGCHAPVTVSHRNKKRPTPAAAPLPCPAPPQPPAPAPPPHAGPPGGRGDRRGGVGWGHTMWGIPTRGRSARPTAHAALASCSVTADAFGCIGRRVYAQASSSTLVAMPALHVVRGPRPLQFPNVQISHGFTTSK